MTTKRERLEQSSIEAATSQRAEYYLGLTEAELKTLERLLKDLLYTGKQTTLTNLTIQNILRKMNKNSELLGESSEGLSSPQQFRELKQELQHLRKRVNELEDHADSLHDELEAGDTLI